MNGKEIIAKVKELNFPTGSYVVFGSCPLALAGIREAKDIDLLVSEETFKKLIADGWKELVKAEDDKPLVSGVFEAHSNWDFSSYSPTLKQLLVTATVVDNVPFTALEEVRKWKAASGRPKDTVDITLIDDYLKKRH